MTKRIVVIGAGSMARVRARALLATGKATICGVASRSLASARTFGGEIECDRCFDDYRHLEGTRPDAALVEVPHAAQDDAVLWALERGLHVLVGGCPAASSTSAKRIGEVAAERQLVVEAGYEARYEATWEAAKQRVTSGDLGTPIAVRSIALWDGDPETWYYQQAASGGMPLTHMTYCFINPIRWIMGDPSHVSAFSNRIKHTGPEMVAQETCVANLRFDGDVICSMTASFIKPGQVPGWSALFLGTNGAAEVFPGDRRLTIHREGGTESLDFSSARDAFEIQAEAFLGALDGHGRCRNTPEETAGDVRVAEAIAASCRQGSTIRLG